MFFNVLYAHSYFPITFSVVGKKEWAYKTLKTYGWTGNWTRNPCNSCQEIYHCATQADIHGTYSPIYYTCLKTCTSSKTMGIFFIHSVSHFGNVVDWKPLARKNELLLSVTVYLHDFYFINNSVNKSAKPSCLLLIIHFSLCLFSATHWTSLHGLVGWCYRPVLPSSREGCRALHWNRWAWIEGLEKLMTVPIIVS